MGQSATKDRIVEAGKKVIFEKGFHSARVSDITSEAGVAHGTFYLYFKTKEEFLLELLNSVREEILSTIEEGGKLIRSGDVDRGANLVFVRSFELMVKERELAKIFFFEAICTSPVFLDFYRESKSLFLSKLCKALELLNVSSPELKAEILIGTARHLVEEAVLRNREVAGRWKEVLKELGVLS